MIINKVNIISFGGIKNKSIEFDNGINVIYGENEAGKSTIQAFIKIWLYGFSNLRSKDLRINERERYMPLSGEKIRGELYIEHDNKKYIIKRTFGKTKKEDTSSVIYALTGEEVEDILKDEPGRYFLSVNRSTFIKTLFIGQLDSEISKDKDEEILEKVLNSVGVGEGDITLDKAFLKMEGYKKILTNSRKTGYLDKMIEKYNELSSEKYESYKLSEQNLDNEEKLISLTEEKNNILTELSNLEIYKKYLKKVKLKKEYEELTKYLRKKEELEEEERKIESELRYKDELITISYIDSLKDEYSAFLNLIDIKKEYENKLIEKTANMQKVEEPFQKYKYVEELGRNISHELIKIKLEQDSLKEKIDLNIKIDNEIESLSLKKQEAREFIGNAYKLKEIKSDVETELQEYEDKLKKLKSLIEDKDLGKSISLGIMKIIVAAAAIIAGVCGIIISDVAIKAVLIIISLACITTLVFWKYIISLKNRRYIITSKNEIKKIESKLDYYNKLIGVGDFGQLIRNIKLYNDYLLLSERINEKIKEKNTQKELLNLDNATERFNENNRTINKYLELSSVNNIEDLIKDVYKYEEAERDLRTLRYEIKSIEENLKSVSEQAASRKNIIKAKMESIGIGEKSIFKLEDILKEFKEKIAKRDEVHRWMLSIEDTYSALIKDKDISLIRNELKEIIDVGREFSYEKEEEVDDAVKKKSNRLIDIEKNIKDLENEINNTFKGRKTISDIEREMDILEEKITNEEKNLKAVEIARETLKMSYNEIRDNISPEINKSVLALFKNFTDGKYKDVLVSDKYEMKVTSEKDMMPAKLLSNGANDQLYLALRIAFIKMIFNNREISMYLDDAFTQYDDKRVKNVLLFLSNEKFSQILLFTCQKREGDYLKEKNIKYNYISI